MVLLRTSDFSSPNAANEVNSRYKENAARILNVEARFDEFEQKEARRYTHGRGERHTDSLGAAVVRHSDFGEVQALAGRRGKITLSGVKAVITTGLASGGALVPPDVRVDPLMMPRRRLTVRDLLGRTTTSSSSVQYAKQQVRTLDAGVVSEGMLKPESTIAFELADAPVRTIATWSKLSRQSLSDAPVLRDVLDSELTYAVKLAEEEELLAADGSGQHLHGLIPQAEDFVPPFTAESETRFDMLLQAIAQVKQALLEADGVVLNDMDLEQMRSIKDSEGRYIFGGPGGPPITSIWGKRVVGTPAMEADSFLVGAFQTGAVIFDREEIALLISTENENDFVKNLATALVEERLAFAVKRPQAFVYGTFGTGT